ncbi:helix-turn-helix domain-containing protein [Pectobacterium polaris]|uniref:helix-turn-helix domain-containing protein n=1 Tax=Pectobacterium polaris TaxID=2042057 RepID=UPI002405CBAE|nr:helix-turn-helix transcriptional regulator [Pectobacterium polaris]MDG0799733.1 helix-turn-helix transcriptional regulator [Pectobacterium polaris]
MALKFYESPFHVMHDAEVASKMAMKMDLSIMITNLIKEKGWTQKEAAEKLGINQSRVSELKNAKIELFTIDAMFDMLDALGFRAKMSMPSLHQASITITEAESAG